MNIDLVNSSVVNNKKVLVFNAFLVANVFFELIFAVLNLTRSAYLLSLTEFLITFMAMIVLIINRKLMSKKVFFYSTLAYLSVFSFCHLLLLRLPGTSHSIYVWMYLIPPIVYFLQGKKIGFIFTLIFSIAALPLTASLLLENFNELDAFYNIAICHLCIWLLSHFYESTNADDKQELRNLSIRDALTKLYNRGALQKIFNQHAEIDKLTVIVIDIDFFKRINDRYGHDAGDETLVSFAHQLTVFFDEVGYVLRLGGEEFCILLPDIGKTEANEMAVEFLMKIRDEPIVYENYKLNITFSAGVTEYPKEATSFSELLISADKRLYGAKNLGRNRIIASD